MKHSKWIALAIYLGIITVCFMPWTYYPDLHKSFNGFYSENNVYGKPGKFFVALSLICISTLFVNKVWARFTQLFFAGLMLAYTFYVYRLFTASYNVVMVPQKLAGIYLLLSLSVLSFLIAMFPEMKVGKKE